ncbi:MAG: archease [Gemmatimonadota bacterium]
MTDDSEARVRALDHTADIGLEIEGPSLESVIAGAAVAMTRLMLGDVRPPAHELRTFEVAGAEPSLLLRNVLRELLFLHAAEGFALARCHVVLLGQRPDLRARCRARGGTPSGPPDTEIKGVTLHGLVAELRDAGVWYARVIFDV